MFSRKHILSLVLALLLAGQAAMVQPIRPTTVTLASIDAAAGNCYCTSSGQAVCRRGQPSRALKAFCRLVRS